MAGVLDKAHQRYLAGDPKGATDEVDAAYFLYYEKLGFEMIVLTRISGERASIVEYQFSAAKKSHQPGGTRRGGKGKPRHPGGLSERRRRRTGQQGGKRPGDLLRLPFDHPPGRL
jgi:hypothetical protein